MAHHRESRFSQPWRLQRQSDHSRARVGFRHGRAACATLSGDSWRRTLLRSVLSFGHLAIRRGPERQERRGHRHGCERDSIHPAHRAADRQTLYFSAHASLDRAAARLWHLEKWRERFRSVPALTWLIRKFLFFALEWRVLSFLGDRVVREHADAIARRHLESSVSDPQLRAALTAHYQMGCKRILLSADFYPVFQRPSVELLTERIAEIRERSVVTEDGAERPVDVLIYLNPASRSPFFADLPGKARFSPGMFAAVDDSRQK